jgi:hypothetical protein
VAAAGDGVVVIEPALVQGAPAVRAAVGEREDACALAHEQDRDAVRPRPGQFPFLECGLVQHGRPVAGPGLEGRLVDADAVAEREVAENVAIP